MHEVELGWALAVASLGIAPMWSYDTVGAIENLLEGVALTVVREAEPIQSGQRL